MSRKRSLVRPAFFPNTLFLLISGLLRLLPHRRAAAPPARDAAVERHLRGGYIEDQYAWRDVSYGKDSVGASGCGVIAAYNALRQLLPAGKAPSFSSLLASFEKRGILWGGHLGTAPQAVEAAVRAAGCATRTVKNEKRFEELAAEGWPCLLLTWYNDRDDLHADIHTMHIERTPAGLIAHNALCDGTPAGPFPDFASLRATLNSGRSRGICLTGVRGPET